MTSRNSAAGVDELLDATAAVGLRAELPSADSEGDLVLINPVGGDRILVEVKRMELASADRIENRIRQWDTASDDRSVLRVVVADRITQQARQLLEAASWGWLDLRGHLHLAAEGLYVDANVPGLREPSGSSQPLAGRVGQEVAALLLLDPSQPAAVREIARTLGRSASTVSQAIASMRQASLVDDRRKPVVPDLFWELADRWKPNTVDLQSSPSPTKTRAVGAVDDALRLGLTDVEATSGWALTDTLAAAAYGAPVGARSDHPPDFYVPDQTTMRRALHLLGPTPGHESRAATIRIAPFPLVCARRIDWPDETWPLARPLFVALDLASDLGRGREILAGWSPPSGAGQRV